MDVAAASGADLRTEFSVDELIFESDVVCGIRGRQKGGSPVVEKARLVIGADGMHSTVAKAVRAAEYDAKPPIEGPYFSYWSGVQVNGFEFHPGLYRGAFGWMTNDGLALIGVGFAAKDHPAVRADIEGNNLRAIAEDVPGLAERMESGRREDRFVGGLVPNYFRKPFGPGWALVGDAGYLRDPCTAEGITDAFHSAELPAEAINSGLSGRQPLNQALAAYEQERNKNTFPLFEFTCQLATLGPPLRKCSNCSQLCTETRSKRTVSLASLRKRFRSPSSLQPKTCRRFLDRIIPKASEHLLCHKILNQRYR